MDTCCTQVTEKQAALASLETQLGSTNSSAAHNRDQIQKLQLQMTELQDQHMAWQQNMLGGRLQELRVAAAKVENNQAVKVSSAGVLCTCLCLPACLPACLSVYVCISVCGSGHLSVYLSACLPACMCVCLFACLPACLSVCLSVCVCLPVCLFADSVAHFTGLLIEGIAVDCAVQAL